MHKYLIITGGSRGIGEQTIARFIENGWRAINISRTPCKLPNVINFNIDLALSENIQNAADQLSAAIEINAGIEPGTICLVHNAAHYKRDKIDSLSLVDLQKTLEINVVSSVALNKIFIPMMKAGSSIIYLGSTLAEKAVPGNASYIISKHAVIGLMRATCQDLANQQIKTCCICPGLVDTQLLNESIEAKDVEWLITNKIMGKRLIEPAEIANVIYFCATNPVINGEVIHANLGQMAD